VKIARVFATKTKMCPTDEDCYFGNPDLFTPKYDEILVSVTFTWAIKRAMELKNNWEMVCKNVKLGGCAFDDPGGDFIAGRFLKEGVIITSRGCPNTCEWCFVPKREGKLRELKNIVSGNIVQDNNLLACSESHIEKVFNILKHQTKINFSGGLESSRITDKIVDELRGLKIYQLWLSFDYPDLFKSLTKAVEKLKRYFRRDQIRCYVLIGYNGDALEKAESRLRMAWELGTLPFAQRYAGQNGFLYKEREWNLLCREWSRPAIIKTLNKEDSWK